MFDSLLTKLKILFQNMFDIRVGEFRRVGLMFSNVFLLILCLWIIKPIVNAQFLSRVGVEKLPLVFFLVAIAALAVSSLYSSLLNRISLGTMIKRTYLISILCLLIVAILFNLGLFKDWMSYLFYIGAALFGLITTSQFWLLGNIVFNSPEAKRLFGFIGAGAIAGGISGGYLTSILAPIMVSTNLLYVAAGILVISLGINHRIWIKFVHDSNKTVQVKQKKTQHEYPLNLIRNSKHLTYLALIIGISVVVAKLVEYQYSAIASARIKDADNLTAFFGFWFSTSNAVSLAIQLFVTQRLIVSLGVGRSLLVLPGALFAGAAMVLYTPVLWAGTGLKLLDISLKQSINKAATELLIMPVPMGIKNQTKTFIDVFVDTTATGLGGILLIFLINGLNLSVRAVCIMILVLICIWIFLAIRVRKEYALAIQDKLALIGQTQKKKKGQKTNTSVAEELRITLRSGTTQQILFLLKRIEESKDRRLMQDLIPLLMHESPAVRRATLRCLYYHTDHTIVNQIEPLLKDPDVEVRSLAFSCILAHTRQNRLGFIEDSLNDEDPAISGAAIAGFAMEARDNLKMQQLFNLNQIIHDKINQTKLIKHPKDKEANKILVASAIGYGKLEAFYPKLKEYMRDENPSVIEKAILSAGSSRDTCFVKLLLPFLINKSTRATAKKALSQYTPEEIFPVLAELSQEKELAHEIMIELPALAETMDSPHTIDYLYKLVQEPKPAVRLKALEALHKVKAKFPHLSLGGKRVIPILRGEAGMYSETLAVSYVAQRFRKSQHEVPKIIAARNELVHLLERRLDNTLERIFWILGLNHPPDIVLPLYKDLHHMDPTVRIHTVELLDNILKPAMKKVVIPIVETAILDTISEAALDSLDVETPAEISSFESLLKSQDDQLKIAVLKLIEVLEDPDLLHLVRMAADDENAEVSELAKRILEKE